MSHDQHESPMDHGFQYPPFLPRGTTPNEKLVAVGEALWRHGLNLYELVAAGVVAADVLAHWNSFAQTHPRDCGSPDHYAPNRRGEVPAFHAASASASARHEEMEHEGEHEMDENQEYSMEGAGRGRRVTRSSTAKRSSSAAAPKKKATTAAPKKAAAKTTKKSTTATPAPTARVTRSSSRM